LITQRDLRRGNVINFEHALMPVATGREQKR
jgi:hypothetical protein